MVVITEQSLTFIYAHGESVCVCVCDRLGLKGSVFDCVTAAEW